LLNISRIKYAIAQNCTRIGISSKTARFPGFNMLPDVAHVMIFIKHLTSQLSSAADITRFCKPLNCSATNPD